MSIKIFATGGSIDKRYSTAKSSFVVAEPAIEAILTEANVQVDCLVEGLLRKDSLEITEADRQQIRAKVRAAPQRHIVITHGTDTMIETAQALSGIPGKVIVLTGAMQPAAFKETDAAFNIGGAIIAVQTLPEGVHVIMNGQIFDPHQAKKNLEKDKFEETAKE